MTATTTLQKPRRGAPSSLRTQQSHAGDGESEHAEGDRPIRREASHGLDHTDPPVRGAHGWTGTVTNSGYQTLAQQTAINNSGVRPAAKPGTLNHEMTAFPGGAVDVTNASQLSAILARSPYAQTLVWAGSKDPVHFSHPHNGSY